MTHTVMITVYALKKNQMASIALKAMTSNTGSSVQTISDASIPLFPRSS